MSLADPAHDARRPRTESGAGDGGSRSAELHDGVFDGARGVAAHSTIADMSKVPAAITDALRSGDALPDARLDALASFTRAMVATRGLPRAAQVQTFFDAGYGEDDILQILLAIAVKTISNYSNHLFHTAVDPAFAARTWER